MTINIRLLSSILIGGLLLTPFYTTQADYKVFAVNDLGMHCVDEDFSVFSILPPYNVVNAQVITQDASGKPFLLNDTQVKLRYFATADRNGSINSTSKAKTNFWSFAKALYGASLKPGQGLKGLYMPADTSQAVQKSFRWNPALGLFSAEGIPILPLDDTLNLNRYPLMRVAAFDKVTNKQLAAVKVVLPVSEETTCSGCHTQGGTATRRAGITWANDPDPDTQSRKNILLLHDALNGTQLDQSKPVLCAGCHYSPALDLTGSGPNVTQQLHRTMSKVMHSYHAGKMKDSQGRDYSDTPTLLGEAPVPAAQQACYQCHPGASTQCLRGAMADTLSCQNCHGNMQAGGGDKPLLAGGSIDGTNDYKARRPWKDLPRCQSCHTGDAVAHLQADSLSTDQIRLMLAFASDDPSASPRQATNRRFAEEPNKLFRYSKGHGGMACEACHGSTHAIWPNSDPYANDNAAAIKLQGHAGTITECSTCHKPGSLPLTLKGPHGLHNVNDSRWTNHHADLYERNPVACQACHGKDLRGTVLSRAAVDRTYTTEEFGTIRLRKGDKVGCYTCHNGVE